MADRRDAAITLRRATARDRASVREICGKGDYLPDVFDTWVRDRRGGLWVAMIRGRAVGVAKLTLLGENEAWLHGLRVHPRYRRRGVAGALLAHRLERAKRLGARLARLDTSDDNAAVRRLTRRFGFRQVARFTFWRAPALSGTPPRRAHAPELAALERLVRAGDSLLHERYVRRALSRANLGRAVERGRCLVAGPASRPTALAIVDPTPWPLGKNRGPAISRLRVLHLSGSGPGMRELLAALPAEAHRRGLEDVGFTAAARYWPALRVEQYRRPWKKGAMVVYAKAV